MLGIPFEVADHLDASDFERLYVAFEDIEVPAWFLDQQVVLGWHDHLLQAMRLEAAFHRIHDLAQPQVQGVYVLFTQKQDLQHTFLPFTSCSKVHLRFPRPQPEAERAAERHYPRTLSAASHSDEVPEEGESVPRVFLGSLAWAPIGDGNSGYRRLCVKMAGRSKVIAARAGLANSPRYMPTTQPRRWYHRGTSPVNVFATGSEHRAILEYANAARQLSLAAPPGALQALFATVTDRAVLQYANTAMQTTLSYPVALIDNTTPPQIRSPASRCTAVPGPACSGQPANSPPAKCGSAPGPGSTCKVWQIPYLGAPASLSAPGPGDVAGKMPALLGEAPRRSTVRAT